VIVSFTRTTISGNQAGGDGGGIKASTAPVSEYPPTVSFGDSTISGNHAGGRGGGVDNQGFLSASITQITGNRATHGGGGIYDDGNQATVTLGDSTPAGNKPDNCEPLNSITGCTG
jgi:predicted outer membrane repeat protein